MRFVIHEMINGKYRIVDMLNGRYVRFGYNNPPLYATATGMPSEWQNYYSALGFCQKMDARNDPLPWVTDGIDDSRITRTGVEK